MQENAYFTWFRRFTNELYMTATTITKITAIINTGTSNSFMDAQRKTESALFDHSKNEKIFPSPSKSSVIVKKSQIFHVT
jgi:hypothetical protein